MTSLPLHTMRRRYLALAAVLVLALLPSTGLAGQPQHASAAQRAVFASFTQPLPGMTVKAGAPFMVIWNGGTAAERVLNLMQGDPGALQVVQNISMTVDGASGQYAWNVPVDLPAGKYALALGQAPTVIYTGLFDVTGHDTQQTVNNAKTPSQR
ncbi:GPI anchored serine-threonine rich family protein [Streptomyces sp. NPDC089919]|uniref:GPI anchored serine-threonine rich family protein n=1 Tax=Streptomyces sp. NPDC089919 TaxID=3155188 RepID=UPI00344A3CDD